MVSGTLCGFGPISGAAAGASTAAAGVAGEGSLRAGAVLAGAATGAISSAGAAAPVAGVAIIWSVVSGNLSGSGSVADASVAVSLAAGTLCGFGPISGAATGSSGVDGTLAGEGALSGQSYSSGSANGSLSSGLPASSVFVAGNDTIIRRFSDAMQRRGRLLTLRHVTNAGPAGPNPPSVMNAVLNGNVAAGATVISIRATAATGRIRAGDQISIGAFAPLTVAADIIANTPGFDPAVAWVPGFTDVITAPLPADAIDGTALAFTWQADAPVWASVAGFDFSLQNTDIIAGDLDVTIAAYGVAPPADADQILIDGQIRSVRNVLPKYQRGLVVAWRLQAR